MMRIPIKVKLLRNLPNPPVPDSYTITQIVGAVTVGSYNGQILRAGDKIDEKQAEHLTRSYAVTVGASS